MHKFEKKQVAALRILPWQWARSYCLIVFFCLIVLITLQYVQVFSFLLSYLLIQRPNESLTVCYFEYCTVLEQGYFFFC